MITLACVALSLATGCHPAADAAPPDGPRIEFKTSAGDFIVALDTPSVPASARHVLQRVAAGDYDNTLIHLVLDKRLVGGGGLRADGSAVPSPTPALKNQWNQSRPHRRGTFALARRMGDPRTMTQAEQIACHNSAWTEFFISTMDNAHFDMRQADGAGFTVVGVVVEGMDVVDAIAGAPTRRDSDSGKPGRPIDPITIESARQLP
jgi:cyclophilin family peptidyl-prolyl cis-trans isomerase